MYFLFIYFTLPLTSTLLVITEEDLNRQPSVTTDLEAILQAVQLLYLIRGQIPAIKLKVRLDTLFVDGLGDNGPALLQTPCEKYLLRSLTLSLGEAEESLVLVEG